MQNNTLVALLCFISYLEKDHILFKSSSFFVVCFSVLSIFPCEHSIADDLSDCIAICNETFNNQGFCVTLCNSIINEGLQKSQKYPHCYTVCNACCRQGTHDPENCQSKCQTFCNDLNSNPTSLSNGISTNGISIGLADCGSSHQQFGLPVCTMPPTCSVPKATSTCHRKRICLRRR